MEVLLWGHDRMEKRNGIDLQVKKKKSKWKYKAKQNNRLGNKENIGLAEGERKESLKEKEKGSKR